MRAVVFYYLILTGIPYVIGKCLLREYGTDRKVCVCNKLTCDEIDVVRKTEHGSFLKYTSNIAGLRFEKEMGHFEKKFYRKHKIAVFQDKKYQKIIGFGGAFTDAVGINIMSLDEDVRNYLMRSYFSEVGIEYNLGRVPMGATDFSTYPYTYHDDEDDTLSNFALSEEDYKYKIPIMNWAKELSNNRIKFYSTPWTSPKWMKTSGEYVGGRLKENMYQTWADYYIKFFDAYKKEGISFWGTTTGNEADSVNYPNISIPGVAWNSNTQKNWLTNNLGPSIRNSLHSDIKILILDDQRVTLTTYTDAIFNDTESSKYADGAAVHWYANHDFPAKLLTDTHNKYPDKFILGTEASEGNFTKQPVQLGLWRRAENYASDIIEDVNHWVSGWTDWNMALDVQGGPTYTNNFCDAAIIVNSTAQEFLKQPMFYAIGHFSKFVPEDSRRIGVIGFARDVPVTAFKRPDGGIVVVILNKLNSILEAVIQDRRRGSIPLNLTAHSLTTLVYW